MRLIGLWQATRMAAVLLISALAAPAQAAEPKVAVAAPPVWVEWLPTPPVNPERLRAAEDGYYDLLFDTQTRLDAAAQSTFRRRMMKVIDRSGLEDVAQTSIDFDPAFDRLVVNRVAIWRDGKMLDRHAEATIEILRREKSLDDGILTGERTAVVRLQDVQVGDVVDIAWTWQSIASIWRGEYFNDQTMGWSVPVGITRFRLIEPRAKALAIRQSRTLARPTVRLTAGMIEREWRLDDPEPTPDTDNAPAWWHGLPHVEISSVTGWDAVARWGARHFAGDTTLPAAFAARIDAIAAASADPGKRAIAALRLVQDSIRYTSLSIGSGGFVPRAPATVVASGFGDCKDKSQLLAVTLRRLGIAAWPALTDSDEGPGLGRLLPSANAFDHAIVLARIGGRDVWMDATAAHQGGRIDTLAALPYGFALPLRAGQASLVAIPSPAPKRPTMSSVETYRRVRGGAMTLGVVTVFTADEADIKRNALARDGLAKTERSYLDYYRDSYPGLKSGGPVSIADDRDANRLTITEQYRLPTEAPNFDKTLARLPVYAGTLRGLYKTIKDTGQRSAPIWLPWTINRMHRIVLDMPGIAVRLPDLEGSRGAAFDLNSVAWHEGSKSIMEYRLLGKAAPLPASAATAYAAQEEALNDMTNWSLDVAKPGAPDLQWGSLAIALFLIVVVSTLAMIRGRNRRAAEAPVDDDMQTVIRHAPITRRRAV